LKINVHIYSLDEYQNMKMINRKSFLGLLIGGAALVWAARTPMFRQLYKSPDLNFLRNSNELLKAICECIIPATDSPGAAATGTHLFVMNYVEKCLPRSIQVIVTEGLKNIEQEANEQHGKAFASCSKVAQIELLRDVESKEIILPGIAGKAQQKILGKPFFQQLKELTVLGYCTSKPVATQVLQYQPVPGHYQGCINYSAGQNCHYTT
jgi:hypothetical protein